MKLLIIRAIFPCCAIKCILSHTLPEVSKRLFVQNLGERVGLRLYYYLRRQLKERICVFGKKEFVDRRSYLFIFTAGTVFFRHLAFKISQPGPDQHSCENDP